MGITINDLMRAIDDIKRQEKELKPISDEQLKEEYEKQVSFWESIKGKVIRFGE